MIKYEVIKLADTRMGYLHYTFYVDRVMITLQPRRAAGYQRVEYYPRVDDDILTLTDLARSLPETVYSAKMLGQKINEARHVDIRGLIVGNLFRYYKCSSDDKRRILLNLKPGHYTTEELMKKSVDLLAERNKVFPFSMELHLMSLEDLLNLFPDSDDDADAARAKLLTLCI